MPHFGLMNRVLFLIAICSCASAVAEIPRVMIEVGDAAPVFESTDDQGRPWKSTDYVGRGVVVVYFYPADMSQVCTQQARSFQQRLPEFKDAGVMVVGVSGDSVRNHQLFKQTNSLRFPLLADEQGKVAKAFGVPVRKGGRISRIISGQQRQLVRGVTAQRWTYIIGNDGNVLHKSTAVDAGADCASVLKIVRQLTASAQ